MREFWVVWDTLHDEPHGPLFSEKERAEKDAKRGNGIYNPDFRFEVRKLTMEDPSK
jgi:hypothetical protein